MTATPTTGTSIMTEIALDRAISRYAQARTTGRRLAWARQAAGVSQDELAAYVGMSRRTIGRVEHGARALRPAERAAAARALGTSIAIFSAERSS